MTRARSVLILVLTISMLGLTALADRTTLKQGWNLFTTQQDIEMGRHLAEEANSTLSIVTDNYAVGYIQALGNQLASHAPGTRLQYQFKIVNDSKIDAFALPGGFIYVTTGLIQAAKTEPQLAGALAHQIGHLVMRHATQQVSKAWSDENPGTTRSRVNVADVMSDLDIGFGYDSDSLFMKYSPEFERQADLVATQVLYDAGFDPRQMTLAMDSHPSPGNRATRIRREIRNMGGLHAKLRGDSPDLHKTQNRLSGEVADSGSTITADRPSTRMISYQGRDFSIRYPSNWKVSEEGEVVTIAPENATVSGELAYGMRIATFEPDGSHFFGQNSLSAPGTSSRSDRTTLTDATDQLLNYLRRSNPNMRVVRTEQRGRVDGEPSMTMDITNDSPRGGRETDWLVTVLRPDGLLYYFIGVAPQRDFSVYESTFEEMIASVRFN
jgi:beta-barrel assembly-enhancing protease